MGSGKEGGFQLRTVVPNKPGLAYFPYFATSGVAARNTPWMPMIGGASSGGLGK